MSTTRIFSASNKECVCVWVCVGVGVGLALRTRPCPHHIPSEIASVSEYPSTLQTSPTSSVALARESASLVEDEIVALEAAA